MSGRVKFAQKAQEVSIAVKGAGEIGASLSVVEGSDSIVVMAIVSGCSRASSRNCFVAEDRPLSSAMKVVNVFCSRAS